MADVKFTIRYDISTLSPIPTPRATVTMKVKTDEDGFIPANIRCMDRIILEPMSSTWGDKMGDPVFRIKKIGIESESWPAIQARVEETILGALAKMQEADERYRRLIAEQPADYVYETSVPGPENLVQTQYKAEPLHKVDGTIKEEEETTRDIAERVWREVADALNQQTPPPIGDTVKEAAKADIDNREWAMRTFGLSQLPCESAANFLMEHSNEIARYGEQAYGQWSHLSQRMRFQAGVEWLEMFDEDDEDEWPIGQWIEWARNHRA